MIQVALVYPNTYHVGMSNLGFQTVYALFNSIKHVVCEIAFLSDDNRITILNPASHRRLKNLQGFPEYSLSDADIIAFSVSFENDYLNILTILEKADIPLFSRDRGDEYPLIIAGGVACFLNPEPIAPFIDCFLLGEAEVILPRFFEIFEPDADRKICLKNLAKHVPGAYVPEFYHPLYHKEGTLQQIELSEDVPSKVRRPFVKDISNLATYSSILTDDTAFESTFLIEVSRGCPHGCRFCSAGYVYRPPRFRSLPLLKECIEKGINMTDRIGLVGAAVSDLPGLAELCHQIYDKKIRISFSSLRADALSPEIISVLKESRVKTATIAPDAGSQRMRDIINKGLNEESLLNAAQSLVLNGIPNLKLYFMIGLPGEFSDDIEAIIELCKKIKAIFLSSSRAKGRIGEITVSVNPFVPKPFTPFQWAAMEDIATLKRKIKHIKDGLKRVPNLRVHADITLYAHIHGLLSRGDRRMADLLMLVHKNKGNWAKSFKEYKEVCTQDQAMICKERESDEMLPWDFIEHGINKSFLLQEYKRAKQGKTSPPCRMESCKICGVCS